MTLAGRRLSGDTVLRRGLLTLLVVLLLGGGAVPAYAAPALEGEWILVVRQDSTGDVGGYELFMVRPDGTGLTNLTNGVAQDYSGEVSPDGTAIAFSSGASGFPQIWVMESDGTNRRLVSQGYGYTPTWTPDGTAIAYAGLDGEVHVVRRDGTGDRLLAAVGGGSISSNPDVSPDGSTVVFDLQVDVTRDVYSVPLAGGTETRLTTEGGFEPEWSPDGSQIAFTTFRADYGDNFWVMNPDGSNQHNLFGSEFNDFQLSWSPDGGRVVFESVRGEDDIAIVVRDLASGTLVDVLATTADPTYRNPSWVKVAAGAAPSGTTTTTGGAATTTVAPGTETGSTITAGGAESSGADRGVVALLIAVVAVAGFVAGMLVGHRLGRRQGLPPPPAA